MLVYGATMLIVQRYRGQGQFVCRSRPAPTRTCRVLVLDTTGVTGFAWNSPSICRVRRLATWVFLLMSLLRWNSCSSIGQVYRTLRELEAAGHVTSSWSAEPVGPQRRDYELTESGYAAIDAWAAVMKERARLIGEFNGMYLEAVTVPRARPR